jgi:hypothetical protein
MSTFWYQTYTGIRFDLAEPTPEMVEIVDVAHHLSLLCRFNGAVRSFYSVAEHCVRASFHVDKRYALRALLHDATEDLRRRPLKHLLRHCSMASQRSMSGYDMIEESIWKAIQARFGLEEDPAADEAVKVADNRMLATERRALLSPPPDLWASLGDAQQGGGDRVEPYDDDLLGWGPIAAEREYLARFSELGGMAR